MVYTFDALHTGSVSKNTSLEVKNASDYTVEMLAAQLHEILTINETRQAELSLSTLVSCKIDSNA